MAADEPIPGQRTVDDCVADAETGARSLDVVHGQTPEPSNGPVNASELVPSQRPAVGCPICHTAHEPVEIGAGIRVIPCPAMRRNAVLVTPGFAVELQKAQGDIRRARPQPVEKKPTNLTAEQLVARKLGRA